MLDTEHCQRCGAPLRLEDLYCSNCGAPVPEPSSRAAASSAAGPRRRRSTPWAERIDDWDPKAGQGQASRPTYADPTWWEEPLSQRPMRSYSTPSRLPPDSRWWAAAAPLSVIVGALFSAGVLSLVCPILIWQIRKDRDEFSAAFGRETLNALLSFVLYIFVALITAIPLAILTIGIWIPLLILVGIAGFATFAISMILATVRALNEQPFRFPLTIRFFR